MRDYIKISTEVPDAEEENGFWQVSSLYIPEGLYERMKEDIDKVLKYAIEEKLDGSVFHLLQGLSLNLEMEIDKRQDK